MSSQSGPNDPDGGAALKTGAKGFVDACLAEPRVDPTAPYYATKQAAEDLEAFRLWLGVRQMSLYGESYGTQFVQTYAAAHPDAIKVLFTDGPVDLATSGEAFFVEGVRAFENALCRPRCDCTDQAACSGDVTGGNELTAYQALAARLAEAPVDYTFTKKDGSQETRHFTLTDLQTAAVDSMSSEGDRELFQRAMVAASRGQVWWLARLLYGGLGQDPEHAGGDPGSQLRGRAVLRRGVRGLRLLPRCGRRRRRVPTPTWPMAATRTQRERHGVRLLRRPSVRLLAGAARARSAAGARRRTRPIRWWCWAPPSTRRRRSPTRSGSWRGARARPEPG